MEVDRENPAVPDIYLFINSSSGGGIGKELLDTNVQHGPFSLNKFACRFRAHNILRIRTDYF
jgi:hypothetical protein